MWHFPRRCNFLLSCDLLEWLHIKKNLLQQPDFSPQSVTHGWELWSFPPEPCRSRIEANKTPVFHRLFLPPPWLWASTAAPSLSSSSSSSWPTTGCMWCSMRGKRWSGAACLMSARLRKTKAMPQTPVCRPVSGKKYHSANNSLFLKHLLWKRPESYIYNTKMELLCNKDFGSFRTVSKMWVKTKWGHIFTSNEFFLAVSFLKVKHLRLFQTSLCFHF